MQISEKTIKALTIVKGAGFDGIDCTTFAIKMWPDDNMHTKHSNQGHGACMGKAAWLCAGSYLSKLQKAGLVHWAGHQRRSMYRITEKGRQALRDAGGHDGGR